MSDASSASTSSNEHALDSPNWNLIDEISIPLLESGVGTLQVLQAALPSILAIDVQDEKVIERYRKVIRISQLQIQHLLRSQQEILKHLEKVESSHQKRRTCERKMSLPVNYTKFKCDDCGKMFLNENFLSSHFDRRHSKSFKTERSISDE